MNKSSETHGVRTVNNVKEEEQQELRGIGFSLEGITHKYGAITALNNVSLQVEPGDTIGIFGHRGSGKSTLCDISCGYRKVQSGSVAIDSKNASRHNNRWYAKQGIRRIFSDPSYFDDLTLEENVIIGSPAFTGESLLSAMFAPRLYHTERITTARQILEYCGVDPTDANKHVRLDYQTKKLVDLARALMGNPKILILDEATRSLSDEQKEAFYSVVFDYVSTFSTTLLLIENDLKVVNKLCKRALCLDAGELLATGDVISVLRNETVRSRYPQSKEIL